MAEALPARPHPPLLIAISDCLLGSEVRYDGGSARASFPHTLLQGLFEFYGICPEVGVGMGAPRDPIRLVGTLETPRAVGVMDPDLDVTEALAQFGRATAATLTDVVGYVFMKNSPSCGLFSTKVYPQAGDHVRGVPVAKGRGVHAAAVTAHLPDLPVEENGRLHDPILRANFVTRVFAYGHWQACFGKPEYFSNARLGVFHRRYACLLMAHSEPHYWRADQMLRESAQSPTDKAAAYLGLFMQGLGMLATSDGHGKVLLRLRGELERHLDRRNLQQLDSLIASYRRGEQPLSGPLTLLKQHLAQSPQAYLRHESYLDPHPGCA